MSLKKIAVVTDSTSYIPANLREKYQIRVVPLSVTIDGATYLEEEELSAEEFYKIVKSVRKFPISSQPAPSKFITLFESLKEEGFNTVIVILLSSKISGTYQNAVSAGEMIEGIDVIAVDSGISCMAQGALVVKAAECVQHGLPIQAILSEVDELLHVMDAYFIVDDLNNLQRGGRLTGAQAIIGSLLQIKPILHFDDKQIVLFEKVRTQKKAIKRIEELLANAVEKKEAQQAYVIHGNCPEKGEAWRQALAEKFPTVTFKLSYFGPVIGTHLGEGALGLTWTIK